MDAVSGKTFETINPATEKVIASVAEGDKVRFLFYIDFSSEHYFFYMVN